MFHRILAPSDPRWASCDPDYTLAQDLFAQVLAFFGRHYHVVTIQQVLDARRGVASLPPRALLITFDDGWQDNLEYALPTLQAAGMPGLLFAVADAIDRKQPFYQERIVAAWRRGALGTCDLSGALLAQGHPTQGGANNGIAALRALIAVLEQLPIEVRGAVLAALEPRLDDGFRHMLDREELRSLRRGGVEVGLHGKSHEPLTRVDDLDAELGGAREAMRDKLGGESAPNTMSFPHGKYDPAIAQRALQSGYELVFTSVPTLNPAQPTPGWLLGRLGFETDAVADRSRRFRPDWLALYLFRRPQRLLA